MTTAIINMESMLNRLTDGVVDAIAKEFKSVVEKYRDAALKEFDDIIAKRVTAFTIDTQEALDIQKIGTNIVFTIKSNKE